MNKDIKLLLKIIVVCLIIFTILFIIPSKNKGISPGQVSPEINALFENKAPINIYPSSRIITITKGESGKIFLTIGNNLNKEEIFSYNISAKEFSCQNNSFNLALANELITLGKERENIIISSGKSLQEPLYVKFNIPINTSSCMVRYRINVFTEKKVPYYKPIDFDLKIID